MLSFPSFSTLTHTFRERRKTAFVQVVSGRERHRVKWESSFTYFYFSFVTIHLFAAVLLNFCEQHSFQHWEKRNVQQLKTIEWWNSIAKLDELKSLCISECGFSSFVFSLSLVFLLFGFFWCFSLFIVHASGFTSNEAQQLIFILFSVYLVHFSSFNLITNETRKYLANAECVQVYDVFLWKKHETNVLARLWQLMSSKEIDFFCSWHC